MVCSITEVTDLMAPLPNQKLVEAVFLHASCQKESDLSVGAHESPESISFCSSNLVSKFYRNSSQYQALNCLN